MKRTASACWDATGAGAAEHLGVLDDIDIVMGTFSKSLASVGGFVAAERAVVDYLKHTARPFVFSASLPPASVAAVAAALDMMRKEPERQQRLLHIASRLRDELRLLRFSGAGWRNGHRAGGGARTKSISAGCARRCLRKASTSIRCCVRRPRRTCCASRARRRIPSGRWSGWWIRWSGWPSGWRSSSSRTGLLACLLSAGRICPAIHPPTEQQRLVSELAASLSAELNPHPRSLMELEGLGREVWQGVDVHQYLRQERSSWDG